MSPPLLLRTAAPIGAAVAFLVAGCRPSEPTPPPAVPFDTAAVWVHSEADSVRLLVEVADTDARRSRGLMMREHLDPGSGMLFVYETTQPGDRGFWMWRTLIPLDVAFLDEEGTVVRILSMEPCPSAYNPDACPAYEPGVEWRSAVEANRGWFAEHGFGVGARVTLEGGPPTARSP